MSSIRAQVEELFHEASSLPRAQRRGFVEQRAGGSASLISEVMELLATLDEPTGDILSSPPLTLVTDPGLDPDGSLPERMGPFRIVGLLGAGGMGRVYEAEQESPRRRVALKVIGSGMMSRSVLRRFEHEVQILASLQHPGIAQVYQAGSVAGVDGVARPYFAMELVRGPAITTFARERSLPVRARLALLADLCDAVHHAHQRGVIHCDLKPGNVLIAQGEEPTGQRGVMGLSSDGAVARAQSVFLPKVLDFGIARLVDENSEQATTMRTQTSQVVGTLAYMAPEQLDGPAARLDTRCDIYALGVIGYELLAGKAPLDLASRPLPEAARLIREEEPTRLGGLEPAFRGDIETIIGKALEKDRDRRYSSAAELAEDLRRFLRDEPIAARPASAFYQISKFARRNRALVWGAVATFVTLCAGAGISTVLAIREASQRALASQNEAEARAEAARAGLAAAAAELRAGNGASARARLAAIPEPQRGWEWRYLHWLQDRSAARTKVEPYSFSRIQATPDGWRVLLSASNGSASYLWTPGRGADAPLTPGPTLPFHLYGIAISPKGSPILLMPSSDQVIMVDNEGHQLWSASATTASREPFSADGEAAMVLQQETGRFAKLDAMTGRELASMPGGRWAPMLLADGSVLYHDGASTRRAAFPSGELLTIYPLQDTVAIRRGNHIIGSTQVDLAGFDLQTGVRQFQLPDAARWTWTASVNGDIVVTSDPSGLIRTFDGSTGQPIAMLHGHNAPISHLAVAPDDRSLVSLDGLGEVRSWDLHASASPFVSARSGERESGHAISRDGSLMVFTGWGHVQFADAKLGVERGALVVRAPAVPASASFSATGQKVAIAGWNQFVLGVAAPVLSLPGTSPSSTPPTLLWRAELGVRSVHLCWWHADALVAAACEDGSVRLLHATDGSPAGIAKVATAPLALIAGDDQRDRLIAVSAAGEVRLIRGQPLESGPAFPAPKHPACVALESGTGSFAIAGKSGDVLAYSGATGSPTASVNLHAEPLSIAYSADGARVAVGCADSVIRILDAKTLREIIGFASPAGPAMALSFTDQALLATGKSYAVAAFEIDPAPALGEERLIATEARRLIEPLIGRLRYSREVAKAVESAPGVPQRVRAAALDTVLGRGDPLNWYNSDAWDLVRRPGRSPESLAAALRDAEFCCRAAPDRGEFHNTRGVALLRLGRYPEAIRAIKESQRLIVDRFPKGHPVDAATLSLCYRALGQNEAADRWLAEAEGLMTEPMFQNDADSKAMIEEARAARQVGESPR